MNLLEFAQRRSPLELLRNEVARQSGRMDKLAQDYASGKITRGEFTIRFQSALTDAERRAMQLGQKRLTPDTRIVPRPTRAMMAKHHNEQLKYFRKMLDDLPDISAAKLSVRSRMYVQSSEGLYHEIVKEGQPDDMIATWNLSPAEHCDDCLERDGKSWPVKELPFVPRDGSSKCLGNCRCYLTYSKAEGEMSR